MKPDNAILNFVRPVRLLAALLCIVFSLCASAAPATGPAQQDLLVNLRHEHPRLLRTSEGFEHLKKTIRASRVYTDWQDQFESASHDMDSTAPVSPPCTAGQSILATQRIMTLGGLYRLNGNRVMARRAIDEMIAAASFPDWSPEVELIFGQMTFGMALGYDWLYDQLSSAQRTLIRQAIIEKGLKPGIAYYDSPRRWVLRNENHNQVSNACMIMGALAIADEEPEIARKVLREALKSLGHSMPSFKPDGGWAEGPGYWRYGTGHLIAAIAAMETAIQTDAGLCSAPGFPVTGNFPMHATGPSGRAWNFSDGEEMDVADCSLYWLATRFNHPEWATYAWQVGRCQADILALIYADDKEPAPSMPKDFPRDAIFRETFACCFRGAWDDPAATYVGFKGGYERLGHWHLDVGSFVLDSQRERWAIDLGAERYSEAYFSRRRWDYYRANNRSHNTLTINDELQDPSGIAPVVSFLSTPKKAYAVVDMSRAYRLPAASLHRGAALLDRRDVLVQDDFDDAIQKPLDVVWNMLTRADVVLDGSRATLNLHGEQLHARILSPAGATFELAPATAPQGQSQQPDVRSLRIRIKTGSANNRIAVFFSPAPDAVAPELVPLQQWIAEAPMSGAQPDGKQARVEGQ